MSAISAYGQSVQYSPYGNSNAQLGSNPLSDFLAQMDSIINSNANTPAENSNDADIAMQSSVDSHMRISMMRMLFEMLSNQTQSPIDSGATASAASSDTSSLLQQKASSSYSVSSDYTSAGQGGGISLLA